MSIHHNTAPGRYVLMSHGDSVIKSYEHEYDILTDMMTRVPMDQVISEMNMLLQRHITALPQALIEGHHKMLDQELSRRALSRLRGDNQGASAAGQKPKL